MAALHWQCDMQVDYDLFCRSLQVNEAQLHGAVNSKYSTYRPALTGASNSYATGVSTRLPLR